MCGRFTFAKDFRLIEERFNAIIDAEVTKSYNAAPTQALPVILDEEPGRIQLVRWGLVPSWARDPEIGNRMINARAETITEKPAFRGLIKRRRCLVVADGFYEWKSGGGVKQPFHIQLAGGEPFAFAGLWDEWLDEERRALRTFTIITTEANEFMRAMHHRMPVILPPEDERRWLDARADVATLTGLLKPYDSNLMTARPVSRRVNSVRNNTEDLLFEE